MTSIKKRKRPSRQTATQRQQEKRLEKQERDKLICYRFSQLRNASRVAHEYGVSRMYVTRLWERMPDEEREVLLSVREQVDKNLNQKIVEAEAIAGDPFTANIVKARELLGTELIRRCEGEDIRTLSDKDFTSLLRLVASIVNPENNPENPKSAEDNIFKTLRHTISLSINKNDE